MAPSHRELLPVLWDMGILPEVRVLGPSDFIIERTRYATREDAVAAALPASLDGADGDETRARLEAHFEEIWSPASDDSGFMRGPSVRQRESRGSC